MACPPLARQALVADGGRFSLVMLTNGANTRNPQNPHKAFIFSL